MASIQQQLLKLHLSAFTGKVVLTKDSVRKSIYLRKGNPIFVESSIRSEALGQILLEDGKITQEQYETLVQLMEKSGKRQGELLVELGYMSGFDVYQAMSSQMERKLQNSFLLEGAKMDISTGENELMGVPDLPVDFFRVYLDTAYAQTLAGGAEDIFPEDKAIRLTPKAREYLGQRALSPSEAKIVRFLNGKMNLSLLKEQAMGDVDELEIFLQTLHEIHFLELVALPIRKFQVPASQAIQDQPLKVVSDGEASSTKRQVVDLTEKKDPPTKARPVFAYALRLDQPFHQLLEVNTAAPPSQVQRAYDKLIRALDLDRLQEAYEGKELDVAVRVFDRLTLAKTVLSNPTLRETYFKELKDKKSNTTNEPSPQIQAEVAVQKSKVYVRNKDYKAALELIQKAIELCKDDPSYHVEYAELLMMKATAEKTEIPPQAEDELKMAIKLNPSFHMAWFHIGTIAKLRGDLNRAAGAFQKVCELKKDHPQASAELRLLNKRIEEAQKNQSAFSKLFKKKQDPS